MTLLKKSILYPTLSLMLSSQTTLAETNLSPKKPITITRDQEEKFVDCFESNMICHETVKRMAKVNNSNTWEDIFLYLGSGFLLGFIAAKSR